MADFYLPVVGVTPQQLADTFGAARSGGRSHMGIDIFAAEGTDVVAVRGGTVVRAGDSGGLGGMRVWIRDDQGMFHYYAHLSSVGVQDGQRIAAGQRLGAVGRTGNARNTPPHLHYSVNPSQSTSERGSLNPYQYLSSGGAREVLPGQPHVQQVAGTEPPFDPLQAEIRAQRMSSDVMAQIMDTITQATSEQGGQVLDMKAVFGDVFQGAA